MTDRVSGLVVTLEKDMREDDAQNLVFAISQLRGVAGVSIHIANVSELVARQRVRHELADKILEILFPKYEEIK